MASVVDLLFSKVVSSEDVLQWLTDPEYLPGHSELELTGLRRSDFIANFVNFIRDQCPLIQQSSSPAQPRQPSPAPVKVWSTSAFKSKGPGDVVQNSKLESVLCSRSRPSAGGRRQNTARVFGGNGQTSTYVTPVTRRDLPRTGATDAAGQETVPRRTDRRVASKEVFTSAVFAESAFVPDFGDSGVFPAVGTRAEHHRGENSQAGQQHHQRRAGSPQGIHFRTDALQQNRITTPVGCKDEPQGVDASVSQEPPEEVQPEEYVVPVPSALPTERSSMSLLLCMLLFLNRGLIVNITVELFFLLQLLTAKQKVGSVEEDGSTKLLHSVHNCTHFAVAVLRDILAVASLLGQADAQAALKCAAPHGILTHVALWHRHLVRVRGAHFKSVAFLNRSHCFTGSQIFFYEFCKFAANSIFLQHFKDQCVWKIVEFEADNPFQDAEEPLGEDVLKVCCAVSTRSATSKVAAVGEGKRDRENCATGDLCRDGLSQWPVRHTHQGERRCPLQRAVSLRRFGQVARNHAARAVGERMLKPGSLGAAGRVREVQECKAGVVAIGRLQHGASNLDFVVCLAVWCPEACTRSVLHAAVPLWQDSRALAQVLLHFDLLAAEDLEESLKSVLDLELPATVAGAIGLCAQKRSPAVQRQPRLPEPAVMNKTYCLKRVTGHYPSGTAIHWAN
ncbi:hypothetical protein HPB48_008649 [Haemaphysalis longicornis]|uniref:Uncharacterized protein n=1 Tax=Haemaphysalis longicornis TaxID=44386 RepID=A0A9J6FCE7_HAELO|nr:hypothetical protein HPB48_008649 [Haemaphysalis longicornis]